MWALRVPDVAGAYSCMRLRVQCHWVNSIKSYRSDIDLLVVHREHVPANLQWRSEGNAELMFAAIFRYFAVRREKHLKNKSAKWSILKSINFDRLQTRKM